MKEINEIIDKKKIHFMIFYQLNPLRHPSSTNPNFLVQFLMLPFEVHPPTLQILITSLSFKLSLFSVIIVQ